MLTTTISSVTWDHHHLSVFGIGANMEIFHKIFNGQVWIPEKQGDWMVVPGNKFYPRPAIASATPDQFNIVGIDHENFQMLYKYWDGDNWRPATLAWEELGEFFIGYPAVISWGTNRLDFFGINRDRQMLHKSSEKNFLFNKWTDWENLGGSFTSNPAIASWGSQRIDIVGLGDYPYAMFHKSFDGNNGGWLPENGWGNIGGTFQGDPSIVARAHDRLDIFGIHTNGEMYHKSWEGDNWNPQGLRWNSLGGKFISSPVAVSWGADHISVLGLGTNNGIFHRWWDGSRWLPEHEWQSVGGIFTCGPTAISWGRNRLDVFGLGTDNGMFHRYWDGNRWYPNDWENLGGVFISSTTNFD